MATPRKSIMNKSMISFSPFKSIEDINNYFEECLQCYPNTSEIKDEQTRAAFESLKKLIMEINSKCLINQKRISEAKNHAFLLSKNCQATCNYLSIENGQKIQIQKDDPQLVETLNSIKEECQEIASLGDELKKSINFDKLILKLIEDAQFIMQKLKIQDSNGKAKKYFGAELKEMENTLTEIQKELTNEMNLYKENTKKKISSESMKNLKNQQITLLQDEIKEFQDLIKKLKDQIQIIQKTKDSVNIKFDKEKAKIIKKHKDNVDDRIKQTNGIRSQIVDEKNKALNQMIGLQKAQAQKINYVVMIDKSGSMVSNIKNILKSVENFFKELKKYDTGNFYFSIIYFDDEATTSADTIRLSTINDFKQFLNFKAEHGTNYAKAFNNVFKITSQNIQNNIDRVSVIFFTDGENTVDAYSETFDALKNIKILYDKRIVMYVRALGLNKLQKEAQGHLQKISSIINKDSESIISLQYVDFADDVDQITKFFIDISKLFADYYLEVSRKLKSLETLTAMLDEEEMEIRKGEEKVLDFELGSLEKIKDADFKNAETKSHLVYSHESKIKKLEEDISEHSQKIKDHEQIIKQCESDITLFNNDGLEHERNISQLKKKFEDTKTKIADEKAKMDDEKIKKISMKQELYSKKFIELGFNSVNSYLKFKTLFKEFKNNFKDFDALIQRFGSNIKNFPKSFELNAKKIESEMKFNKASVLNEVFDQKIKQVIDSEKEDKYTGEEAKDEVNNETLGKAVMKMIKENAKFIAQDVINVCKFREDLINIIAANDVRERNKLISDMIGTRFLVDLQLENETLDKKLEELNDEKSKDITKDEELVDFTEELVKLQSQLKAGKGEEEEQEEWNIRKKELNEKIKETSKKISTRESDLKLNKRNLTKEIEKCEKQLKFNELEKQAIEKKFDAVFGEIREVVESWLRAYADWKKREDIEKPLNFLRTAPKMISAGNDEDSLILNDL